MVSIGVRRKRRKQNRRMHRNQAGNLRKKHVCVMITQLRHCWYHVRSSFDSVLDRPIQLFGRRFFRQELTSAGL